MTEDTYNAKVSELLELNHKRNCYESTVEEDSRAEELNYELSNVNTGDFINE